ncbi:hypothetical protein NPX13_g7431 [Xylaria arbuscula]|uniref:Uncharacterized protein n=1 Tax=Xylaria arbuscula TaxID=114810 RepID=A0A9W8NA04_9PEZI|nr:hypothetical protein NPX13_g7431 [Xylaria arbuscula]
MPSPQEPQQQAPMEMTSDSAGVVTQQPTAEPQPDMEPESWRPSTPNGDQELSGSSVRVDPKGKGKALVQFERNDDEDEDDDYLVGTGMAMGQAEDGPTHKVDNDSDETPLIDENEENGFAAPVTPDTVYDHTSEEERSVASSICA